MVRYVYIGEYVNQSSGIMDDRDIRWGSKQVATGPGSRARYDSFFLDTEEFKIHDSVFLNSGKSRPYIGKLRELWQDEDGEMMCLVRWFFYPTDVPTQHRPRNLKRKEVFLAIGNTIDAEEANSIWTIEGKAKVLCTMADPRNPQPLPIDLIGADQIFWRLWDVEHKRITTDVSQGILDLTEAGLFNKAHWVTPRTPSSAPRPVPGGGDATLAIVDAAHSGAEKEAGSLSTATPGTKKPVLKVPSLKTFPRSILMATDVSVGAPAPAAAQKLPSREIPPNQTDSYSGLPVLGQTGLWKKTKVASPGGSAKPSKADSPGASKHMSGAEETRAPGGKAKVFKKAKVAPPAQEEPMNPFFEQIMSLPDDEGQPTELPSNLGQKSKPKDAPPSSRVVGGDWVRLAPKEGLSGSWTGGIRIEDPAKAATPSGSRAEVHTNGCQVADWAMPAKGANEVTSLRGLSSTAGSSRPLKGQQLPTEGNTSADDLLPGFDHGPTVKANPPQPSLATSSTPRIPSQQLPPSSHSHGKLPQKLLPERETVPLVPPQPVPAPALGVPGKRPGTGNGAGAPASDLAAQLAGSDVVSGQEVRMSVVGKEMTEAQSTEGKGTPPPLRAMPRKESVPRMDWGLSPMRTTTSPSLKVSLPGSKKPATPFMALQEHAEMAEQGLALPAVSTSADQGTAPTPVPSGSFRSTVIGSVDEAFAPAAPRPGAGMASELDQPPSTTTLASKPQAVPGGSAKAHACALLPPDRQLALAGPQTPQEQEVAAPSLQPEQAAAVAKKPAIFKKRWEVSLSRALESRCALQVHGLDPYVTSPVLQEVLRCMCGPDKVADARVLPLRASWRLRTRTGLIIFSSDEAAREAYTLLTESALVLSADGMPLLVSYPELPRNPFRHAGAEANVPEFPGHITLTPTRALEREDGQRTAIATAHFAQPNTIEYEHAANWRRLQEQHHVQMLTLIKRQEDEIASLLKQFN